jgi:hypothetical protein
VGESTDRLSVRRPRSSRVRASRLPARRRVLLIHVLPDAGSAIPTRAASSSSCTARRSDASAVTRCWCGPTSRGIRSARRRYQQARGKGGARLGVLGRSRRDRRRRARPRHQDVRRRSLRWFLPDSGHVDRLALRGHALHAAHRRRDDVVLRLVRGPAGSEPAGIRRPDRRPRVRRLVGRHLPDDPGLQRSGHEDTGRALDGGGAVPRHEGRHGLARLRRQHEVRR